MQSCDALPKQVEVYLFRLDACLHLPWHSFEMPLTFTEAVGCAMPVRAVQALGGNTQKTTTVYEQGPLSGWQSREPLHKLVHECAGSILDLPMIAQLQIFRQT